MSWARATLRRGTSSGSVWQVDANYPQARVVVGSAATAGWVVAGQGIAPYHVELYWDGNGLYVCDPQGMGDVRLDGRPVHAWVQVQGRGQLVFGQAILELETAVAEATAMVRDPGTAPRISLVGESTRVQDAEIENERTRVASSLEEIPPSKAQVSKRPPAPPGRVPAHSVPPPPPPPRAPTPPPPAPPAPPAGAERPRLGGAPQAGRAPAKTLVAGEELAPIGGEATRMVDTDALAAPSGFGGPPQGFGGPPQPGFGAPQQGFGAPQQGFGAPQQGFGAPQPGFGAPQPGFGAPQPGFGGPAAPAPAFGGASGVQVDSSLQAPATTSPAIASPGSPSAGGATSAPTGGFVAPPAFDANANVKKDDGSVPRRTRLLIMLFAAVVIAWLMMPTPEEEEAAERAAHPPPPTATVIPPGVDGGVDAGPPQYANPSTFVPVLTTETADGGLARTPDSIAAQLVNDGHLEDALVQYEALRTAHPERPEYGVMCEVLRRQLMSRCVNGQRWNGQPCAP